MRRTLSWLASEVGGEWKGDPEIEIRRVVHPAHAEDEHDLALVYSKHVAPIVQSGRVRTALVPLEPEIAEIPNQLRVARPRVTLARLLQIYDRPVRTPEGIHPSAVVDPTARLAPDVKVGPNATIGPGTTIGPDTVILGGVHIGADVEIGERCFFFSGVVVGDRVRIGHRVILKANCTIGNDGFSFQTREAGSAEVIRQTGAPTPTDSDILRINSVGTVVLEDDVEIGACTCVDRATLHETRIARGTKVDNHVQIAHNVQIGQRCLIMAQAGIAGSAIIGDRAIIGAQAGIPDHLKIGEDSVVMPQSGVPGDLPPRSYVGGTPAEPRKVWVNNLMQIKRIKTLARTLKEFGARLEKLEAGGEPRP